METKRVAAVTGGLIIVGGIAGALASALAVFLAVVVEGSPMELVRDPAVLVAAGVVGAVYGAVLGPLAAWLLMRHVPLGIAIGGTMLGTLVAAVAALLLHMSIFTVPPAGFALAALVIRVAVPRPARVRVEG